MFGLPSATPKSTIPGANFQYDLAGGQPAEVAKSKQAFRTIEIVPSLIGITPNVSGVFDYRGNLLVFMGTSLGQDASVFVRFDDPNNDRLLLRVGTSVLGITFDTIYMSDSGFGTSQTCYFMVAYDPSVTN